MHRYISSDEQREWERTCGPAITTDALWKLDAFRAAMFLLHVTERDCRAICVGHPNDDIARQLRRAAGSVAANLSEGYSRSTRADRLSFLNYAFGSTRECIVWYHAVSDVEFEHRLHLLARLRALMSGLIRSNRERSPSAAPFEP